MASVSGDPFNGGDLFSRSAGCRGTAGTHRPAIQVHGAGAALSTTATILRASQAKMLAQHPKQGSGGLNIHHHASFIYGKRNHSNKPPSSRSFQACLEAFRRKVAPTSVCVVSSPQ